MNEIITNIRNTPNFNTVALGKLDNTRFQQIFGPAGTLRTDNTAWMVDEDGYRCIGHFYGQGTYGSVTGLNQFTRIASGPAGINEVWYGFRFKFEAGFQYPISGKFYGITVGSFSSSDGTFASGGQGPASKMLTDGRAGSMRLAPQGDTAFRFYIYDHGPRMTGIYGHDAGVTRFGKFLPGQWQWMVVRSVMNNPLSANNGISQIWLDGNLIGSTNELAWSRDSLTAKGFQMLSIATFTGGGSSLWNSPKDQWMYQRDMFVWRTNNAKGNNLYVQGETVDTPMGTLGSGVAPTPTPSSSPNSTPTPTPTPTVTAKFEKFSVRMRTRIV